MKFRINLDALRSVFKKCATFFAKDAKDEKNVYICATDFEYRDKGWKGYKIIFQCSGRYSSLSVNVYDGIDVAETGEVVLRFDIVNKILATVKGDDVDIMTNGTTGKLVVGKSSFNLTTGDSIVYVKPFDIEDAKNIAYIPADKFINTAKTVASFADRTASQAVFGGVYFKQIDDNLNLVATDTRSMCVGRILINRKNTDKVVSECVIPDYQVEAAADIFETCLSEDGYITLYLLGDSKCVFSDGYTTYHASVIEGVYPKFNSVFNKDGYFSLTLDKKEIVSALSQAKICTSGDYRGVLFNLKDGNLELSSESPETGRADIKLDYETSDSGVVKVSCELILKAIKAAGTESIVFKFPEKGTAPIIINPDEPLKVAVMPLSMK